MVSDNRSNPNIIFFWLFVFCLTLLDSGCNKEKIEVLPPNQAKGEIIAITGACYGDFVVVEVENPKEIGLSGALNIGTQTSQNYENAVGVPYFSKIGIPDSIPQTVGTWLHFKYRELTEEEKNQGNLWFSYLLPCPGIFGPPDVKKLIISEVIQYKSDENKN